MNAPPYFHPTEYTRKADNDVGHNFNLNLKTLILEQCGVVSDGNLLTILRTTFLLPVRKETFPLTTRSRSWLPLRVVRWDIKHIKHIKLNAALQENSSSESLSWCLFDEPLASSFKHSEKIYAETFPFSCDPGCFSCFIGMLLSVMCKPYASI